MKTLSLLIVIILILNLLLHLAIIFYKNYSFVSDYLIGKKNTWNPEKDRFKLFISIFSFIATFYFTYELMTIKDLNQFLYIINTGLISILLFISIYVNFYSLEKKVTKKTEKSLVFNKISEEELHVIYNVLIRENRAIVDFNSLVEISKGNNLEKKIKWIDIKGMKSTADSKSGLITYGYIFDIFHESFIKNGIIGLKGNKRKELINFIINNFSKNDEQICYKSLNKSYSDWTPYKGIE